MERLLDLFDDWARPTKRDAGAAAPERFAPTAGPRSPRLELDLRSGEIRSIVWATGFRPDYGWLDVPVVDAKGQPAPRRRRRRRAPASMRSACPSCGGASRPSSTASRTTPAR